MRRFNFFARNEGTFVALAVIGGLAIVPFAVNNFVQGRLLLGAFNAAIAMLAYAMWARGEVGIFWAYPAVLLFHFILERRAANFFNSSVMVFTTFFAHQSYGPDAAFESLLG